VASQQISTCFASWLRYCTDVAQRRSTKFWMMFGCFLGWYTIYTGARCKIHFVCKFCVLLYWQRYCTALGEWESAKVCGVVQGMELRNFRSSSFSTEGASCILRTAITGHILVYIYSCLFVFFSIFPYMRYIILSLLTVRYEILTASTVRWGNDSHCSIFHGDSQTVTEIWSAVHESL